MSQRPTKVAWISFFPVEWLPDIPEALREVPRWHPATWQRVLVNEFKSVPNLKLEICAVRHSYPRGLSFTQDNATFHCVKIPRGMRTLSLFWWETLLLRRLLRRIRPDFVHAWGTERGAALVASRLGFPHLVTMQGLLEWCLENAESNFYNRLEARLERTSLRRAKVVTAESSFAIQWLRERYPHLQLRQAEHAPNWLFHQLERRPETRPLRFLFVGSLCHLKGTDLLFQTLDRLRDELDFRITIIGTPLSGYLEFLQGSTSRELWQRVNLRQNLTSPEVAAEMSQATLMIFPTRVDNSPNSVKEAVVAGLPVVASGVGGILDYVIPGKNGLHCAPGSLDALVEGIRAAAAHPLFSRGQVDPATLARMRDYLSPSTMARNFLEAYGLTAETAAKRKG